MKSETRTNTELRFMLDFSTHRRLLTIAREQDRSLASVLRIAVRQFAATAGTVAGSDDLGSITNAARKVGRNQP